jgi:hypothetical protein
MNVWRSIWNKNTHCLWIGLLLLSICLFLVIISNDEFDAFSSINTYIENNPYCNNHESHDYEKEMKSFHYYDCYNLTCNVIYSSNVKCSRRVGKVCNINLDTGCFTNDQNMLTNDFMSCIHIKDTFEKSFIFTDCYKNIFKKELMNSISADRWLFGVIFILIFVACIVYIVYIFIKKMKSVNNNTPLSNQTNVVDNVDD